MAHLLVYSKPGCHLCEEAVRALLHLQAQTPFTLEETNIEDNPQLFAKYGEQIPVILFNGVFWSEYTVEEDRLRQKLEEVN